MQTKFARSGNTPPRTPAAKCKLSNKKKAKEIKSGKLGQILPERDRYRNITRLTVKSEKITILPVLENSFLPKFFNKHESRTH